MYTIVKSEKARARHNEVIKICYILATGTETSSTMNHRTSTYWSRFKGIWHGLSEVAKHIQFSRTNGIPLHDEPVMTRSKLHHGLLTMQE